MVMLYTDIPAIEYWRPFIATDEQRSAHIYSGAGVDDAPALKRALVRQLMVEANPNIADKIDMQRRRVEYELIERLDATGARLCQVAHSSGKLLSVVLREYAADAIDTDRDDLEAVLRHLFGVDESWIEELLDSTRPHRPSEELIDEYEKSIVSFGIHDWSREPFGGAAHCWRPGADSVKLRELLFGFGLRGRPEDANVHICGEAYSDFQGFIEGALHTAEAVCRRIAPGIELDLPPK
jgi:hypothetical protein